MDHGRTIVVDHLGSVELEPSRQAIYDRDIGLRQLYEDPTSGAEHYLVRYPPGLKARRHRHTAAQTFVVLEGSMEVNGEIIGLGAYAHLPSGEPMHHAPAGDDGCLSVTIFDGPFDVEPLDG